MRDRTDTALTLLDALARLILFVGVLLVARECGQQWRQLRADAHQCAVGK